MKQNFASKILLVDDDKELLERAIEKLSGSFQFLTASSVNDATKLLTDHQIHVVIADLNFEGQSKDGIDLIDYVNEHRPDIEIIVLSADKVTERVMDATRRKLAALIPKTWNYGETLKSAITIAMERYQKRIHSLKDNFFLTNAPKMKELLQVVHKISESEGNFSILITGEKGTGKEVLVTYLAKLLGKKVVTANMASIPRETTESELFGHMKGAFTGAHSNKSGLIEIAHHGIFFLDELGECPLTLQAKLLRVLEQREIMGLGYTSPKKIDVRFIAATNCYLLEMVQKKLFRLDLLQRLDGIRLHIPPLRERTEDIILYANHFLANHPHGKNFILKDCAIIALLQYHWPGNIRELKNTIEKVILFSHSKVIDAALVKRVLDISQPESNFQPTSQDNKILKSNVLDALTIENGNRTKAAKKLGVNKSTLYRWMKSLNIGNAVSGKVGRPSILSTPKEKVIS